MTKHISCFKRVITVALAMMLVIVPSRAQENTPDTLENIIEFETQEDLQTFDLYSSTTGGFTQADGMLMPSGETGEFKAIYKDDSRMIQSVSVELHPNTQTGKINGGLYVGADNAADGLDQIDAVYVGVESHFEGWDDAPNRIDILVGSFPDWTLHQRVISETGKQNNLFKDGVKEPVRLQVDVLGNTLTITLSLVSDPSCQVVTTCTIDGAGDLADGKVGIRSLRNDARYDNFTVVTDSRIKAAASAVHEFENTTDLDLFDLYTSNEGSFQQKDGKLTPTAPLGEFKAIYKESGRQIDTVSVQLHPQGETGMINGGLYINAKNPENGVDQIDAYYVGVESRFEGWEDAPNRIDVIVGSFPDWQLYHREISETERENNLYTNGIKEPVTLRVDIAKNVLTITVSLVSDPSRYFTTTYTVQEDVDLSLGQVGIRSYFNDAAYDNFSINAVATADGKAYLSVDEALDHADGHTVTLLRNITQAFSVTRNATIDLAGYSLADVTVAEGCSLKLIDSVTDDQQGGFGAAKISGTVETFCEVGGKTYLTVEEDGVYSAHYYDVALTHVSVAPAADALGYKAQLYGDETVMTHVDGFGFQLWLDGGAVKTFQKKDSKELTLRLKNILANAAGETNIHAAAFVTVHSGKQTLTKTSDQQTTTMRKALEFVDRSWGSYTEPQKDAVRALRDRFFDLFEQWELTNIILDAIDFEDPVNRKEQTYTFAKTKTYINGQDIAGQWGVGPDTGGGQYGIGDPFVMRYNGKYYMYPSSSTPENGVAGIKVFSSFDMVNWTYEGFAVTGEETNYAYAPEVVYYNGWFYMCQSGSGDGHYIYRSPYPTGPFTRITDNFGYNIDGAFWIADNGSLFFLHPNSRKIYIAPIDSTTMLPGSDILLEGNLNGWTEGPGFFRRGDMLYLTYSGNNVTRNSYRVGYSYQMGTDPTGTFVMPNNNILLLETGPDNFRGLGHNSNVIGPDLDSWYTAYHNLLGIAGPQRRYMLDKLVTNGGLVMANGPTYWEVSVPKRPDYEVHGISSMSKENGLYISRTLSKTVYTAEFNFTPNVGGSASMLFGYTDSENYRMLTWNDVEKTLTLIQMSDGQATVLDSQTIDFLAANVLHTVRIEQGANRLIVYMDSMRKMDLPLAGQAGKIAVTGNAVFGYQAFSNDAFGTSDFETVKIIQGGFPAVHYLKEENRGFQFSGKALSQAGIRQGERENTVYHADTGIYDLLLDIPGDWVKYAVNVAADGNYNISAYVSAASAGAKFQFIVDSEEIYNYTVPAAGVTDQMVNLLLGQIPLTQGNHTLKLRLVEGTMQVQSFLFTAQQTAQLQTEDALDALNEDRWTYDGQWEIQSGSHAVANGGTAFAYVKDAIVSDFTMQVQVSVPESKPSGSANIMFRAEDHTTARNTADSFSGYYLAITNSKVTLNRANFGVKALASKKVSWKAGSYHTIKITVQANRILVYIDDMENPAMDVYDPDAFYFGHVVLSSFKAGCSYKNFTITTQP